MSNDEKLNMFLETKAALEEKLKEKGFSTEELPGFVELVKGYSSMQEKLNDLRAKQFTQEAKEILWKINQVKPEDSHLVVPMALRLFAEHVVWHIAIPHVDIVKHMGLTSISKEEIQRIVDNIPPMEKVFK